MEHLHDVTKDSSHKREVRWSDNDKEIIPDDDEDIYHEEEPAVIFPCV
jgi:hypothetical protein